MKAVFCLLALVSFTSAHPFYKGLTGGLTSGLTGCLTKSLSKSLSKVVKLPSIIPKGYNIVEFDSQAATKAIQGYWYVTLATPSYYDIRSKKTGLFRNVWPCSSNVVSFEDTTPGNPFDYNTDYVMNQYSYNVYTGEVEKSRGLLSSAYGQSKYAIFNVYVEDIFDEPLVEVQPLLDQTLNIHKVDSMYNRLFTVGVIGADSDSYMVFAVLNEYNNVFNIKDKHTIWVLTRDSNPSSDVTNRAINDIVNSGLSPYYLIDIDHSVDLISKGLILNGISSVTDEYSVSKTVSESSTTKSFSVSHGDKCYSASTTETKSTVEYTTEISSLPDYQPFLPFVSNPFVPDVKIMSEFASDVLAKAMKGKYYVNSATPFVAYEDCCKIGLFHTVFPAKSLQVIFDNTVNTPWDWTKEYMMVDRGINRKTGKIDVTKSIIYSTFGPNSRYPIFTVATEGYYNEVLEDVVKITNTGFYAHTVSTTFKRNYYLAVIGFREDDYLILYTVNSYNNLLFANKPVHNVYVLTKARQPSSKTLADIAQDILLSGYDLNTLITIDQSDDIMDIYKFNPADFELSVTSNDSSSSDEKSTIKSLTSSASNLLSSISSATKSLSESTSSKTISTEVSIKLPAIIPTTYKVQPFDTTIATKVFNGNWYVNMATPVCIKNDRIKHTGLLANTWPNSGNVIHFRENTPWDFDVDCTLTEYSYNWITDKVETTRSLFKSAYGNLYPYAIFNFYTEGYYEDVISDVVTISEDGISVHKCAKIYRRNYQMAIAGYQPKEYLILYVVNKYNNIFLKDQEIHNMYVLTRDQVPSHATIDKITQDLILNGYDTRNLMSIDQSYDITDDYTFVAKEYEVSYEDNTSSVTSTSSSIASLASSLLSSVSSASKSLSVANSSENISKNIPIKLPSIIPRKYKVQPFDVNTAAKVFNGDWYVNMATPVCMKNDRIKHTGLLANTWPNSGNVIHFRENTPWDFNVDCTLTEYSYNWITNKIESTRSLFKSAYGNLYASAIFNFYSEGYYAKSLVEIHPLIDEHFVLPTHKVPYTVKYTAVIIGADYDDYLVIVILNEWKNKFITGNNNHLIWVMTRQQYPSKRVISCAVSDITRSGLNPNYLITVDQSVDIIKKGLPEVADFVSNEITTKKTVSTTTSTKSVSVSDCGNTVTASKTETKTTVEYSTDVAPLESYQPFCPFVSIPFVNKIRIINDFDATTLSKALYGKYYVALATPYAFNIDSPKCGLFYTAFPTASLQVIFENTLPIDTPWDWSRDYMMLDRAINRQTGEIESTRSILYSTFGPEGNHGLLTVATEGYYDEVMTEVGSIDEDNIIHHHFADIYRRHYYMAITGYKEGEYLILYIVNSYRNIFYQNKNTHNMYVLTRDRIPSSDTINSITQDILLSGYNPKDLIKIDQTYNIRDEVIFNAEEYEVTYEISTVLEETSSSVSRQSSYYGTAVKSDYGYY
ncbi:uncharacterized protein LOC126896499 isoform X3 [Daktulosphaira vitifoliae]|uniref:uncharacterized protein LOC126896499 isoform X3 n=1 Tax=Daktulosphaira vitifoliae TaxID=58002 RepID=UPI0021AABCC3|nr:uncharacterized protein LOC126896499 isoform X3 [Daktulosphaira vitifoliae]